MIIIQTQHYMTSLWHHNIHDCSQQLWNHLTYVHVQYNYIPFTEISEYFKIQIFYNNALNFRLNSNVCIIDRVYELPRYSYVQKLQIIFSARTFMLLKGMS